MSEEADKAVAAEQERWQKRFDFLASKYGADGGGCDSGDPLDFTEAEVRQSLGVLEDSLREKTESHDNWVRVAGVRKDEIIRLRRELSSSQASLAVAREALDGVKNIRCEDPIRTPLPNPYGYARNDRLDDCGKCAACKVRAALAAIKSQPRARPEVPGETQ